MDTAFRLLEGDAAWKWIEARAEPVMDDAARETVRPIIADVRARGDAALRELTERFDGVRPERLRVDRSEMKRALRGLTRAQRQALDEARASLETFHSAQIRSEPPVEVRPGVTVWREFRPIARVGIYAPGGRADYPSTVLMCGVPAVLAGCRLVVVSAPPGPDGRPPSSVLAAAELLGLEAVFAVGGAQAIAALAFGTESVPSVDKIVGPGNRYVTAAKELVYGAVDIDMPAGPSEIVVLADASAPADWVAADLLSQAEHGPDGLALLITDSARLAEAVREAIASQISELPNAELARRSLASSAACVAPDLETAIDWTNRLAPEHLTIVTDNDDGIAAAVENAGAVFLGPYSPVAAGDYAAGSNHVLPTGRRARSWSGLAVDDFGRWLQLQRLTRDGLRDLAPTIATLARWEGLEGHARAVEVRFGGRP